MPGTSLEVLDGLWDEAKAREANGSQGEAQGAGTSTDEARPREAQGSADESRTPESDGSGRRSDQ